MLSNFFTYISVTVIKLILKSLSIIWIKYKNFSNKQSTLNLLYYQHQSMLQLSYNIVQYYEILKYIHLGFRQGDSPILALENVR